MIKSNTSLIGTAYRKDFNLARHVVCNACNFNGVPSVIADSWAQLEEAQGHRITPDRIDRISMCHKPPQSSLARDIAERAPRISAYIAQRLAEART
jgi:hypothetical protein